MSQVIIPVAAFDLVIFGGTGDLALRKLLPALFRRDAAGQIPAPARIIGLALNQQTTAAYREQVADAAVFLGVCDKIVPGLVIAAASFGHLPCIFLPAEPILLLHLVAMARAAGIVICPEDFADLSAITPLMARVYPNGVADVNHFHAAGRLQFVIGELLAAGLLHEEVATVAGKGLHHYTQEAYLAADGTVAWRDGASISHDDTVLRPVAQAFPGGNAECA